MQLPGFIPVGPTVADFDGDGFLDVFSPHYHAELTRESLPSHLYWGGPDGFANPRVTLLPTHGTHDGPRNADSDQIESHIIYVDAGCAIDD